MNQGGRAGTEKNQVKESWSTVRGKKKQSLIIFPASIVLAEVTVNIWSRLRPDFLRF